MSAFWPFFFFFWECALWVPWRKKKVFFCFFSGSRALFTGPTSTLLKKKFKTRFHSTIRTFKNYFTTVFSIFNKISGIQTEVVWIRMILCLHFFFQRHLYCSWDLNNAFRLMNSNPHCSCTRITLCKRYCALFTGPTTTLFRKKY